MDGIRDNEGGWAGNSFDAKRLEQFIGADWDMIGCFERVAEDFIGTFPRYFRSLPGSQWHGERDVDSWTFKRKPTAFLKP